MRNLLFALLALCAFSTTSLLTAQAEVASETTFIVNSASDDANSPDADPGDGTCADGNGDCTLRAAIDEANATTGTIKIFLPGRLPEGVTGNYTISLVAPNDNDATFENDNEFGDLDITGSFDELSIIGTGTPGPQVSTSGIDRIMDIRTTSTVNISRIWFTGGASRAGRNGTGDGSGVGVDGENGANGGAIIIRSASSVNMDQVTFSGNSTGDGGNGATPASASARIEGGNAGSGGFGGAIYVASGASLDVNRGTFHQNTAGGAGSAASGQSNGTPAAGGNGGDGGAGGAIYSAGALSLTNSTVFANQSGSPASGAGGVNGGDMGNEGEGGNGGGIATGFRMSAMEVTEGTLTIQNTIIAGNTPGDDVDSGTQQGDELFDGMGGRTIMSNGHNLIGTDDAIRFYQDATSDQVGTAMNPIDPVITGRNRAETDAVPTLALGSGSPAIDAGASTEDNDYDARGFVRPAEGTQADIGAKEENSVETPDSVVITEVDVNNTNGGGEFVEIKNAGDYPVQMDDYVINGFNSNGNACLTINLYGELLPGENFVVGDMEVDNVNHNITFDAVADNCSGGMGNQFVNDNGAVAIYKGDGNTFAGIEAVARGEERRDVIVYNNNSGDGAGAKPSRGFQNKMMNDLCGAFGLAEDCAGSDGGDGESIQRQSDGSLESGTPSPGENNTDVSLPVEWLGFSAYSPKPGRVTLEWQTASEEGNEGYGLQHSYNGGAWEETAWVNAANDAREGASYSYAMDDVAPGEYVFRVRQQDYDGTESFSTLAYLSMAGSAVTKVYPNPTSGLATLYLPNAAPEQPSTVTVIDALGRVVIGERQIATVRATLDLQELRAGTYYLRIVDGTNAELKPIWVR